nr:putative TM protein [Paramyxoviridae sp.]
MMDSTEYYGNSLYQRRKAKESISCLRTLIYILIIILVIILVLSGIIIIYKNNNRLYQIEKMTVMSSEKIAQASELLTMNINPKIDLMDRVINYQLPKAIMRAFEVSHKDLKMSMVYILSDLQRITELYKALLGFEDNWNLANDAQVLKCSWSAKTVGQLKQENDNDALQLLTKINDTLTHIENDTPSSYDISYELGSIFSGLWEFVRGNRNSLNNQTLIQLNQYLNECSKLVQNIIKFRYYRSKSSASSEDDFDNVISQLNNEFYSKITKVPKMFFEIDEEYVMNMKPININNFFSNSESFKSLPIQRNNHVIRKRYVREGIFKLPDLSKKFLFDGGRIKLGEPNSNSKEVKIINRKLDEVARKFNLRTPKLGNSRLKVNSSVLVLDFNRFKCFKIIANKLTIRVCDHNIDGASILAV